MGERLFDVITMGRAGIDLYSLDLYEPLEEARLFARYLGGSAANVAVGAARLGLRAAIITRVSDDELGEFIVRQLSRMGVYTGFVKKDPEGRAGIVFAEIIPGRDGRFIFYRERAADLLLRPEDVPEDVLAATGFLVVTGTGLSAEPSRSATLHAMAAARRRGARVVLNMDWRPSLWRGASRGERVSAYSRAIGLAHVIVGNRGEYAAATESEDLEGSIEAVRRINREALLIVTLGEEGALGIGGDGSETKAPGYRVEHLKGLGAGDGFLAGLLYGLSKGWDLYRSLRLGNAVGAIVVTRHSCSHAMPTYDEVVMFLESRGGL